ncbi:hypothetical protein TcG_12994 [Trypanosoma cruzi]|nr:hypothetical protein TcG_12994 [Trypanosoma cruzi]
MLDGETKLVGISSGCRHRATCAFSAASPLRRREIGDRVTFHQRMRVRAILGTRCTVSRWHSPVRRWGFCLGLMFFMRRFEPCSAWLFNLHFQLRNILVVGETVPCVGGQSPGIAHLPVVSRAFMKCFLLRCRPWLCAGVFLCSYAGWWSRFRLSPEFTVRAFQRCGCRQAFIFLAAPSICRGNPCLWKY